MMKSPLLFLLAAPFATIAQAGDYRTGEYSATKFEAVPQGEAQEITELVDLTHKLLEQRYGAAKGETMARRAVHPKAHGCVKANVTVNADLPENYRVGVFATPGKAYKAWIRFSNATAVVKPDINDGKADSRGMAIKLMGVDGDTLMQEAGGRTQDFLLINQPMFAFPDVHEYLEFTRIQFRTEEKVGLFFAPPLSDARKTILGIVGGIGKTQLASPLDATYFSASPFLFGKDRVAKFSAKPRNPASPSNNPEHPSTDYLRDSMKRTLAFGSGQPVTFDLQVQLRPEGLAPADANYPVEIANRMWAADTGAAPWRNVATIVIPPQNFDAPLQNTECEHLVFTPWHGLVEHQPIGGINRLRRDVYIASSKHRADHREPSDYPQWPF